MPLSPNERAKRIVDIERMYRDRDWLEVLAEYLKYDHAKKNGIQPQYRSADIDDMVDTHHIALRNVLIEQLGSVGKVERAARKMRQRLLKPLWYANQ